jgi:hypothetical protein
VQVAVGVIWMLANILNSAEVWHPWIDGYYAWLKSFYHFEPVFRGGYIQHPKEIPVTLLSTSSSDSPLDENKAAAAEPCDAKKAAEGKEAGICFWTAEQPKVQDAVVLGIELDNSHFVGRGSVVRVQPENNGNWVCVKINPEDAFAIRMAEQLCQIEHYRLDNKQYLDRNMSPDEAAQEWINKYAAIFSAHI